MEYSESKLAKNKLFGAILMIFGIFGILVIVHRLSYYCFEYDAKYSPFDYGKFNILSFFTVQSNIFVAVYLILLSLAVLGVEKVKKVAFNPLLGAMITTYIFITGVVYCAGIPLGFTPPFKWDTSTHAMSSFIQVYHHMIVPPLMVILWFFPFSNRKIKRGKIGYFIIYPFVYSIFSIIRGATGVNHFYPYPFYRPEFIWGLFCGEKAVNYVAAYFIMIPVLALGMLLFAGVGKLFVIIHNKRVKRLFLEPDFPPYTVA